LCYEKIGETRALASPLEKKLGGRVHPSSSGFCAHGTKLHLCIVEQNSPTPVRRRFSLTQEGLDRVIPGGEGAGDKINVWRREVFSAIPYSTYDRTTKLQLHWTYQGLSVVPAQPIIKGA